MTATERRLELIPLSKLRRMEGNPKQHADAAIRESIAEFGFVGALIVDAQTGRLVAGHGRAAALEARRAAGEAPPAGVVARGKDWLVPVVRQAFKSPAHARAYLLADNRLVEIGGWAQRELAAMVADLEQRKAPLIGWARDEIAAILDRQRMAEPAPMLKDRFGVPPFSILDARQGYWQERKRAWLALGIESEIGRGTNLLKESETLMQRDPVKRAAKRRLASPGRGQDLVASGAVGNRRWDLRESPNPHLSEKEQRALGFYAAPGGAIAREGGTGITGTSIFDPVVCELAYRWFCPPGGQVLDPFAGGSVRGIVAQKLGRYYLGVDLRPEQVAANEAQAARLCRTGDPPRWIEGDSRHLRRLAGGVDADFVFSCPPYLDLERYSDDPRDLSTLKIDAFTAAYREIIAAACAQLRDDRFACFVVGDVRGPTGLQRNFPGMTIEAFQAAGLALYNPAVLVTAIGSLPIRAGRMFSASRKLANSHQYVLVFCKGDPAKATAACGEVEIEFPAEVLAAAGEAAALPKAKAKQARAAKAPPAAGAGPEWARGQPVAKLEAIAREWRAYDKPYTLGAFSAVKEAHVAEWLAQEELLQAPGALARVTRVRAPTAVRDFSGREIGRTAIGDVVIKRVAARKWPALTRLLAPHIKRAAGGGWLDIWQEDAEARAWAQARGFQFMGAKIRASSEIVGVYARGHEPQPVPPEEAATLVRLEVPLLQVGPLQAAIARLGVQWQAHYSAYNKRGTWSAVALRGYGGRTLLIEKPAEMSKQWQAAHPDEMAMAMSDTPLRAQLPEAEALIAAVPGVKHRIRLMRLAAGKGELARHADITDPDAGVQDGRLMRIHIPIETNAGVLFTQWRLDGARVEKHMGVGEAWYLDTRKPHTAANVGNEDRIHLVLDVEASPALRALLPRG